MRNKIYSFLGLMQKSGNITSGNDTVEFDIKKGKCKLLIIAEDASENTQKKFLDMVNYRKIPFVILGTKIDLGYSIGKSERSAISIRDSGFAKEFLRKISLDLNGGESIVKD
ncbi:MAG: ribosomal protein L7ae [Clostridiales bacterium]|nr:ribosomal protein L7ae [Clostridiales bacterium]